jgi:hypothetical protein
MLRLSVHLRPKTLNSRAGDRRPSKRDGLEHKLHTVHDDVDWSKYSEF